MVEYGIWDDGEGGFIEAQLYTTKGASEALAHWQDEYRSEDGDPADLSIREICPDHEDQPRDGCDECYSGDDEDREDEDEDEDEGDA